jgi:hypothetical protein
MKKLALLLLCGLVGLNATAQEEEKKKPEKVVIEIGKGGVTIVNAEGDTTQIILKTTGLSQEELEEEEIEGSLEEIERALEGALEELENALEEMEDTMECNVQKDSYRKIGTGIFQEANWSGIDFGVGILTRPDYSTGFSATPYLDFDPARSWTINFNFYEHYFGIVKDRVGIVTGLGLNWSHFGYNKNYTFDYSNDTIVGVLDSTRNYRRNRIRAMYLQAPLLIQFNVPGKNGSNFHLSAGVVGGVRIGSQLKQKFTEGSVSSKNKVRGGNYYFNPFKLDAMLRMGIGDWGIFASYNLIPLFNTNVVEPVHNVAFGLSYNF